MDDHQNTTYKLARFFNVIFNPKMYRWLLFVNLIFIPAIIFFEESNIVRIAVLVSLNSIMILDMLFHSPKALSSSHGGVEFEEYVRMKPRTSKFVITHGRFWWLKVRCSVLNITNIDFHQNFIEKIFDVGHISFSGKALFTAKRDLDRIEEKDAFTIYGIKHFSRFRSEFLQN